MEYPVAEVRKLLEKPKMKADEGAVKEFGQLLEEITTDISSEADAISKRAGKKAIESSDVVAAKKKIL
ncbi:MAG: hypothetical protein V1887_03115 [Candidatus Aenigmatarchaeota archaeon]